MTLPSSPVMAISVSVTVSVEIIGGLVFPEGLLLRVIWGVEDGFWLPPKVNKIPTFGNNETQNNSSIPQINISNQEQSNSINSGDVAVNSNPNDLITDITNNDYSLVGVVQLPENASFALFKNNDITEKISVGTEIGTSGWVLMAVNGNQAIVSRENQSRNVRVGESF